MQAIIPNPNQNHSVLIQMGSYYHWDFVNETLNEILTVSLEKIEDMLAFDSFQNFIDDYFFKMIFAYHFGSLHFRFYFLRYHFGFGYDYGYHYDEIHCANGIATVNENL